MCGYYSGQLKFNKTLDTFLGTIEKGTHGIFKGFFAPGTGDFFYCQPDDDRKAFVLVELCLKEPEGEMIPTVETWPRVEVTVPIEDVDLNPFEETVVNVGTKEIYHPKTLYRMKSFKELNDGHD